MVFDEVAIGNNKRRRENVYKQTFNALYVINIVMQSIFTLIFDAGLFVFIGWLLTSKLGAPEWVYVPLILVGMALGVFSMLKLVTLSMHNLERLEENQINQQKKIPKGG